MSPVSNVLPTNSVVGDPRLPSSVIGNTFLEGVQEAAKQNPLKTAQLSQPQQGVDPSVLLSEGRPISPNEQVETSGTSADGRFSLASSNGEYTTSSVASSSQLLVSMESHTIPVNDLDPSLKRRQIEALDSIFLNA